MVGYTEHELFLSSPAARTRVLSALPLWVVSFLSISHEVALFYQKR